MSMNRIILISVLIFLVGVIIFSFMYVLPSPIWNFLVVNETPELSDVIIVLGGGENNRVDQGVSLLQSGYANKILFTGYDAHDMARYALSLGVSNDDILLDDKAYTTYDNAKNSLEIMKAQGFQSAIIVTTCYHTRRSSIIFRHVFQDQDIIMSCPPYNSNLSKNWWKKDGIATSVILEYLKLVYYYMFQR